MHDHTLHRHIRLQCQQSVFIQIYFLLFSQQKLKKYRIWSTYKGKRKVRCRYLL